MVIHNLESVSVHERRTCVVAVICFKELYMNNSVLALSLTFSFYR